MDRISDNIATQTVPLSEGAMRVNLQVKAEIRRLVRKEDIPIFEALGSSMYYYDLIKPAWYNLFDKIMAPQEKRDHYNTIRNIFEIYAANPLTDVVTSFEDPDKSDQVIKEVSQMLSGLNKERQLLISIMGEGIVPGACAYGHLKKKNPLLDAVFVGHTRYPIDPPFQYYKPGEIYITEWDAQTLIKHNKSSILIVDDTIYDGNTIDAVAGFLYSLGIQKFGFAYLRDMKKVTPPP
jgi:adenine/guanine phosphoribosyltransferase-like PRPP-binding protein